MATTTELAPETTTRFSNLLDSLESQKTLLTTCTDQWRKLSTHFSTLEQSLLEKTKSLDTKIQTLETQTKQTLESLTQRESSIPEQESATITHIEELKQSALSELEKQEPPNPKAEILETLGSYCRKMDSVGLVKFMVTKRKDVTMKVLIEAAMKDSAVDPPRLALDAVYDFVKTRKSAAGPADRRWATGLLIAAVVPVEEKAAIFAGKIVERAAGVAEAWKEKISGEGENWAGHVEATMFLHLVVGFGLREKFDEEFLSKLLLDYTTRRDMPKLAAKLGFGEKLGDIIDELVKKGKEIDAVYFASESGLTERFPPVSLLKDFLRDTRKNVATILKNGHNRAAATEEANTLELNSLKNIIRCVEEFKLEPQYPIDSLRKRFSQLEKLKADRKKNAAANKRARGGSGSTAFRPAKTSRISNPYPTYGRRTSFAAQQNPVAPYSGSYNYPVQSVYDAPPATSYTPPYGAYSRSSAALPPYSYPPEDIGVAGALVGGSYGAQTSYGAAYDSTAPNSFQPSYPQ